MGARMPQTILVIDDNVQITHLLRGILRQENYRVVISNEPQLCQELLERESPDMVIVDIGLKDTSGMELIKDLKIQYPELPVLTLSMYDESIYGERALRAGARGYVMKQEATAKVVTAIRRVLAGEVYVSDGMAAKMVSKLVGGGTRSAGSFADNLSDRELEVFRMIGEGFGTREMAEKLHLSIKTVETYRAHIKDKLGLQDANELLRTAIQWVNAGLERE